MARSARLLLILLTPLSLGSHCGGAPATTANIEYTPPSTDLGVGDIFDVRVYGDESMSSRYRVEQDGTIDFPFLGRIEVAGNEPRAVAENISTRLREADVLVSPQVTLFVVESNSQKVSVVGAVQRPGTFPVNTGLTVVQAISLAGGFTALAARDQTVLTRTVGGGSENPEDDVRRFRVPVSRITDGRERDVPVQAGDIIFIPERVF